MRYFVHIMPGRVFEEVLDIARDQHGYVRTPDLHEAGINPHRLVDYHRRGLAERRGHGVYRLKLIPEDGLSEFMEAALWPDGRGVLSHETALDLWELCDVNPARIDVTIPKRYRTHRDIPVQLKLHRQNLDPEEVTTYQGLPVVKPRTAIEQAIEAGLRDSLVNQAIETGRDQAMLTREDEKQLQLARNERRA